MFLLRFCSLLKWNFKSELFISLQIMILKTFSNLLFITFAVLIVNCNTYRRSFESLARLAFEHGVRVNELAACQEPKPQLIYFTDPTKVCLFCLVFTFY